ncbi:MAG TPA: hypothetical protein DCL80_12320 [Balneola sp.]|jgi:hypothetical protein|nr:hypothetical protein [Balneola sp.]MAO77421.1 hypothetical protein [Balneola sp.]MBF65379.1 hypothetical protein [Balneola sp.]HAH51985.1 hypothetical protein [Balneola sp.]HAW78254.1 hypothetical protein [Balneola sp.]|tara:strand:- start:19343 stop:21061 length:1719 start_codon:yes stop_codon:yes gene_type:complete
MKRSIVATFLFFLISGVDAFAQTGSTQNSLLPEIDPQDIEIRSEFRARFPGIRRQPILGFNPKPRVFRIDPNRVPFMESDREAVASIALTQLDRPEPPFKSILQEPPRTNAFVKAGFGSFTTPELEAYVLRRLNNESIASINIDYSSSNGHLENQDSGFRIFDLNGVYGTKLKGGAKLSAKVGAFSDFNHLFELSNNVPSDNSGTPEKDYKGLNAGIILENNTNDLEGWELYFNTSAVNIDLMAPNAALRGSQSEQIIQTGFKKEWAGSKLYDVLTAKIDVEGGNYSTEGAGDTQWLNTSVTFGYSSLFNYATEIELEGGIAYLSDGFRSKPLLVLNSKLNHTIKEGLNLTGKIYAQPEMKSVWEHHQNNRFLNIGSQTQFQYTFGVDGGIEFYPMESTKLFGSVSYKAIDNYSYYSRASRAFGANTEQTFYTINYSDASKFKMELGVTQQIISDKVWFDGFVYAQRPELKSGSDIPFEERLGAEAVFSIKPVDQFKVSSWMQYIGEREDGSSPNTQTVDGYILVNAGADYKFNEKFGVYLKVLNILGQNYEVWQGYEERPFQIFGGIKVTL